MNNLVPDFNTNHDDHDFINVNPSSSSSFNLPRKSIMGEEDDLMELLWQNGQVVLQNPRLNNAKNSSSSVKLHGGEGGEPAPPLPLPLDQNLFIQEDELTSWLQNPLREDEFCSDLLFSASEATPKALCAAIPERQTTSHVTAVKSPVLSVRPPARNFMNFSRLRGNFTGSNGREASGPSIPKAIVRDSTQVNPSATPSAAASESSLIRRTDGTDSRVTTVDCGSSSVVAGGNAYSLAVTGLDRKGKAVATTAPASEIPGTSSSVASKTDIEPVLVQQETEKTTVDHKKRKERVATKETECRSEETKQTPGTTFTKRTRAAEVHNLSERKRRDRINEKMKTLQELIPRCNKSDKASMLDEAIEYIKTLQLQVQMMSMGCGMMPMMCMPHMAMGMNMSLPPPASAFMPFPNMLAAQRPLLTPTNGSGPHYLSDQSRVFVPNQQCDPTSNQPQYPGYMDPYQQFRSLQQTQPAQFQNEATSYPSTSRVSSSKESEDQGNNKTTGC